MPRRANPDKDVISTQELADYLGKSVDTIYKWNMKGTGPKRHKLGRGVYYRWADVQEWIEQNQLVSFR